MYNLLYFLSSYLWLILFLHQIDVFFARRRILLLIVLLKSNYSLLTTIVGSIKNDETKTQISSFVQNVLALGRWVEPIFFCLCFSIELQILFLLSWCHLFGVVADRCSVVSKLSEGSLRRDFGQLTRTGKTFFKDHEIVRCFCSLCGRTKSNCVCRYHGLLNETSTTSLTHRSTYRGFLCWLPH